ncbi:MAG: hypothetical protein OEY73_05760 [Hadesarchaea archaeon]|nr:hypothetical protein [Hadesarchaea archaeon]
MIEMRGRLKEVAIVAVILLVLSFGYFVLYQPSPSQEGESIFMGPTTTFVLDCPLPEVPQSVPLLNVERIDIDENEAIAIARGEPFNMAGELDAIQRPYPDGGIAIEVRAGFEFDENGKLIALKGDHMLQLFYDGPVEYNGPGWSGYDHSPTLPTEEDARRIAEEFLKKVEEFGCFYPKPPLEVVINEVCAGSSTSIENTSWINYWSVIYELRYENMPIRRAGGSVKIGAGGTVVGFGAGWRNLTPGPEVEITVTPEEALRELGSPFRTTPVKMIVEKIELGYWTNPILESQDQVLPVYVFSGTAIFEDGDEMGFAYPVPATNLDYPPLY